MFLIRIAGRNNKPQFRSGPSAERDHSQSYSSRETQTHTPRTLETQAVKLALFLGTI